MNKVQVTDGAGFVGSHVAELNLIQRVRTPMGCDHAIGERPVANWDGRTEAGLI